MQVCQYLPVKGPTAGEHEYFNILASSHIAFCQTLVSPPATQKKRKRLVWRMRGKRRGYLLHGNRRVGEREATENSPGVFLHMLVFLNHWKKMDGNVEIKSSQEWKRGRGCEGEKTRLWDTWCQCWRFRAVKLFCISHMKTKIIIRQKDWDILYVYCTLNVCFTETVKIRCPNIKMKSV